MVFKCAKKKRICLHRNAPIKKRSPDFKEQLFPVLLQKSWNRNCLIMINISLLRFTITLFPSSSLKVLPINLMGCGV